MHKQCIFAVVLVLMEMHSSNAASLRGTAHAGGAGRLETNVVHTPEEVSALVIRGGNPSVEARATARPTYTTLRASGTIDALHTAGNAQAVAEFTSLATFTSPTQPNGTAGLATYRVEFDIARREHRFGGFPLGTPTALTVFQLSLLLGSDPAGGARVGYSLENRQTLTFNHFDEVVTPISSGIGSSLSFDDRSMTMTVPVTFGIPELIHTRLAVNAHVNAPQDQAFAAIEASRSVYWGGIQSLTVGGVEITDFTVTADSGVDYRISYAPIPEPSSYALFLAGIAFVGFVARRRMRLPQ